MKNDKPVPYNVAIKAITNLKLLFTILLVSAFSGVMAQQTNIAYSQYADNLIPVNPAHALLDKAGSINVLGCKQFIGIDGAPATFLFSGNMPIPSINGAAGIFVLNDQFAVEHQTELNAFFAKAIQLTEKDYLSVSINAGVRNYTAYYSSLAANDPQFSNDVMETKPNIGFGVMFFGDSYYLGLSVPELTIRSLGNASVLQANYLRNHYYFTGAFITDLSEDVKLRPAALVSYVDGAPAIANVSGTIFLKEQLGVGVNYSTSKLLSGILSVNLSNFRLGYSYEFGTNSANLGGFNNATNEVSLSYRFGKNTSPKLL